MPVGSEAPDEGQHIQMIYFLKNNRRIPVFDREKIELYDLETDPGELINLNREHLEIAFRLEQELREFSSGNSREGEVDKELRNKLRSLGYIE